MGGNALNSINIKSKRLDKKDFELVTSKINKVFSNIIKGLNDSGVFITDAPYSIMAYKNKKTFGDLDLLIPENILNHITYEEIMNKVASEFNYVGVLPYKEKEINDMTFSFGVPSDEFDVFFQVDLISAKTSNYDFHSKYLNWNDLGNLIGVVASSNGFLKYGHDGLTYQFRDGSNLYREYLLSNDWNYVLRFFGYNVEDYNNGFDELEDIYKYASSSSFFNKKLYSFENRNHTQRTRDIKRPTYNGFLKWIEKRSFQNIEMNPEKWSERVFEYFPYFKNEYNQIVNEYKLNKEIKLFIKKYFNGSILIKYKPDLKFEEIGLYLNELRNMEENLYEFVKINKENSINLLIERKESIK